MKTPAFILIGLASLTAVAMAEETVWPQWRGPLGTGVAPEGNPPVEWSETKNVQWKVELLGSGTSTPIVAGDKVFLLTAIGTGQRVDPPEERAAEAEGEGEEERRGRRGRRGGGRGFGGGDRPTEVQKFVVVCRDLKTGATLWTKAVREQLPHQGHHAHHGYASASPVSDGEHLYAFFGSNGLYCLDLQGNVKWEKDFGDQSTPFGEGSSPTLEGDSLIVKWDHEGDSFIVVLDKKTGEERWRKERDEQTSWSTPFVVEHEGKKQVVASATNKVAAYDLETGELLWETEGMTRNVVPTPVAGDGVVYVTSGFRGSALQAIKLGAKGKLDETEAMLWTHDQGTPYVPSPILYQGRLYFFQGNDARLSCLDAKTGKVYFRENLEDLNGVYASPVAAADRVYFVGRQGGCVVIKASDTLEILSSNKLDDRFDASPAVAGDRLLLRGHTHLYCLAEGDGQAAAPEENEGPVTAAAEEEAAETESESEPESANTTEEAADVAQVAGSWEWTTEGFGGQEVEGTATFKQSGAELSGTSATGTGETAIEDGRVEGETVHFKVVREFGDRSFTTSYEGTLKGDEIVGTITTEGFNGERESDWHAYKAPEIDPTGLWKWTTTGGPDGAEREHWVKLTHAKGELSGLYRTARSQAPITEARLDGKEIAFIVERRFGNRAFTTAYQGTLSEDGISGRITSRGRDGGERESEWKAMRATPEVEVVGTWRWTSRFGRDGEEVENTVVVTKSADGLSGIYEGFGGESALEDVKAEEDRLSFKITRENDQGSFTSTYTAVIDEDLMDGDIAVTFGEREFVRPFRAERVLPEPRPEGTWTWTNRFGRDGESVESAVRLKQSDDGLTGIYIRGDDESELKNVTLEGNTLSFQVDRTFGGNTATLTYRGVLRGDVIDGFYSFGEADENSWVTLWEAKREKGE